MAWRAVCVAILLAGCSAGGDSEVPGAVEPSEARGVVRGVVVDAAVQPLAGARVDLVGTTQNVTTSEAGAFSFLDLEPGTYVVRVAREGYQDAQTTTEVKAGVEPPVVRVVLDRAQTHRPTVVPGSFEGLIMCGLRVPTAGFSDGCGVFGDRGLGSTQRTDIGFPAGRIWWIQTELVWQASSQTSERLCTDQGELLHEEIVCGPSPIVQWMDQATVERRSLHKEETFQDVVYPDHLLADASGNLVIDQPFQILSHAFYNFVPPDGWEFGRDGLPPVPA